MIKQKGKSPPKVIHFSCKFLWDSGKLQNLYKIYLSGLFSFKKAWFQIYLFYEKLMISLV